MRISDWSSDVCSSDLWCVQFVASLRMGTIFVPLNAMFGRFDLEHIAADADCTAVLSTPALIAKLGVDGTGKSPDELRIFDLRVPGSSTAYDRSADHTSELQSLMRTSYTVFFLKKKNT